MPVRRVARAAAMSVTHGLDICLGLGRIARQTQKYVHIYGFAGLFLPYILSADVFDLVQAVLRRADEDALLTKFASSQIQQTSVVAMIGSVIAGNAVAALGKQFMGSVPWPAAAFFHASLVAALFCVYHAMRLNRIVGALVTPDSIKRWLRSSPSKVVCADKNRPRISSVLVLDTPRTLVTMASVSFIAGWSVYVMFVYIYGLDKVAGGDASMNVMIFYAVSLWFAIGVYLKADIFDYYTDGDHPWLAVRDMFVSIWDLFTGRPSEYDTEEDGYPMATVPTSGLAVHAAPSARPPIPVPQALFSVTSSEPSESSGRSGRSERKSIGNVLLAEALRESIEGRRRAIESDEQFVRALEMFQPDMRDSYDS